MNNRRRQNAPTSRRRCCQLLASALLSAQSTTAFYLPGSAPRTFSEGDLVTVLVNAVTPQIASKARLQSLLPYDYYDERFHFCRPGNGDREPRKISANLGSALFGDRLYESPFEVHNAIDKQGTTDRAYNNSLCLGHNAQKHIVQFSLRVNNTGR